MRGCWLRAAIVLLALGASEGCSEEPGASRAPATGGASATGGTGAGGAGGELGSGGAVATGGSATAGAGGTPATQSGGAGGTAIASGGSGSGGATRTGGPSGSGGTNRSGGALGSGGLARTGGTSSAGGFNRTGGVTGTGGSSVATGGTSPTGGATGSGGSTSQAPYKGVANSPAAELATLGATWCYNWGTRPQATDCDDPLFVPMIWGKSDVAATIKAIGAAGYTTVLGFNEPNKTDQANMTVAEAIALWPAMTSDPSIRVGSPAVSDDGRAWLEDFMTQVKARELRVDFVAMHWYGWNKGSCVAGQLEGAVNWASKWGLPVWITEFGCMGTSNPDEKTVLDFFDAALPMLAKKPLVERYAWYPWNTYNHLYLEDASKVRTITALGQAFAAAPAYR